EVAGTERRDGVPVARRDEHHSLALALDDEPRRHGLHASGGQSRHHLLPVHGRDLVAVQAIEDAPCLLRVYEPLVHPTRALERLLYRAGRDLVEDHAADRDLWLELLHEMPRDGLALLILVRRELQLVRVLDLLLERVDYLLPVSVDDVIGLEV